jgi:superfamily II DNA or RNA helicase
MLAEIDDKDQSKIKITEFEWRDKVLLNSITTSHFDGKRQVWTYNRTWQTCLAINATFKNRQLTIGPNLKAWADKLYSEVILPAYTIRSEITPTGWENIMPDVGLYPHQKGDVAFLSTVRRGMLFNGMGSGKSISSMASIRQLYTQGESVFPVLIACPNSTKLGWKKEILKVWPGLRVTVIDGTSAQRKKQFEEVVGSPCQIHNATLNKSTTQEGSAEAATKKTSGNETQSTLSGNERTVESGQKRSESSQTTGSTSNQSTESLPKNTETGSSELEESANSVQEQQKSSTIDTQTEKSEESSVGSVTRASTGRTKTSRGLKEPVCTCGSHVVVINWESIRSHSKLKPYGNVALKRCKECGGLDPSIKATSCEAHAKELNQIKFGTVIGDEIHRIKDPKSKVARSFKAATGDAEFRIGLSGTPIASTPEDLFSPLNWLQPEAYPSRVKYIDWFCVTADTTFGKVVIGIKPEKEQEFFGGIDPFTRRMSKEVILPFLPPIVYERKDVEMGAKQKKAYEQMRDKMIAEVADGDVIFTTSPLVKLTRMLQFSSAYAEVEYTDVYDDRIGAVVNKPVVRLSDPSCKLDAFMDDLPDFGDESIVVFAVSSQLINMLSARLEKAKIPHGLITGAQDPAERQVHMDNFQEGRTKFILCTIAAGGTGITLTKGSTAVFLQRSWSMIENLQAEARVHRIGSEQYDSIKIIDYVTKDSSEEVVFKAVEEKSNNLEYILRDKDLMLKFLNGELSEKPTKKENE